MKVIDTAQAKPKILPTRLFMAFMAVVLICGMIYFPLSALASSDEKVSVTFVTENASISIDGVALPAGTATADMPVGTAFTFAVSPSEGATVSAVTADGVALSDRGDGTYQVEGSHVVEGLTISATAVVEVAQEETPQEGEEPAAVEEPVAVEEVEEPVAAEEAPKTEVYVPAVKQELANDIPVVEGKIASTLSLEDGTEDGTEEGAEQISAASNYVTVTFVVNNAVVSEEQVLKGALADEPETPTNPTGQEGFVAWFQDVQGNPFNFTTPITENITLTAVFGNQHVVKFVDYSGYDLAVVAVEHGKQIDADKIPTPNVPFNVSFKYWATDKNSSSAFTGAVTGDLTLYPVTGKTTVVMFITDGPVVKAQTSNSDSFVPEEPDASKMIRKGYDFSHWSKKPNGEPYTFDKGNQDNFLSGTTYLYAVWTPKNVGYVLNYYNEVENIKGSPGEIGGSVDNYELVYTKVVKDTDPLAGKAGSTLNTSAEGTAEGDKITAALITGSTYPATADVLDYSDFYWTDANTKKLSGDGSTVINLYAKRTVFTFTFDLLENDKGETCPISFKLKDDETVYTADSDDPRISEGRYYSISAKLGQEIGNVWPRYVTVLEPGNTAYFFKNWNGYYNSTPVMVSRGYIQQLVNGKNGFMQTGRIDGRPPIILQGVYDDDKKGTGAYEDRFYYTEVVADTLTEAEKEDAIPSEDNVGSATATPDTTGNVLISHKADGVTRYYRFAATQAYENFQSKVNSTNVLGWPGRDITGFKTINTEMDEYGITRIVRYQVSGIGKAVYKDKPLSYLCYYMPRNTYTLSLVTNGGTIDNIDEGFAPDADGTIGYTKPVAYEGKITLPKNTPTKPGYEFAGWYLDDAFTKPYYSKDGKPVIGTMGASNLSLYAKYVGTEVTVNYYDVDGETLVTTAHYAKGETLSADDLADTVYADATVNGWYFKVDNTYAMASWGMLLEEDTYDLFVDVSPESYTVSFKVLNDKEEYVDSSKVASIIVSAGARNTLAKQGYSDTKLKPEPRDGYEFAGWVTEDGAAFNSISAIDGSMTLYATYTPAGADDPTDPEDPGKQTDPKDPDDPNDPADPGKPGDSDDPEPVVPSDPTPNGPNTPATPGGQTPTGSTTVTPQNFPTPTNIVEAAAIPIAEVMRDIAVTVIPDAETPATQSQITDDAAPLAQGEDWCWVHYYIGFFMVVMAGYTAAVVIRRKKFENDLALMEAHLIGKRESVTPQAAPGSFGTTV